MIEDWHACVKRPSGDNLFVVMLWGMAISTWQHMYPLIESWTSTLAYRYDLSDRGFSRNKKMWPQYDSPVAKWHFLLVKWETDGALMASSVWSMQTSLNTSAMSDETPASDNRFSADSLLLIRLPANKGRTFQINALLRGTNRELYDN